jgi:hypothetical protein
MGVCSYGLSIQCGAMKRFLLFFLVPVSAANAQHANNSGGGFASLGDLRIEWSIGELTLVNTVRSEGLVVSQGLLQPQIGVFSEPGQGIGAGELILLPNPTHDNLRIWADFLKPGRLALSLYDCNGRLLLRRQEDYTGFSSYEMDLSRLAAAVYMLEVVWAEAGGAQRKSAYKIIKL